MAGRRLLFCHESTDYADSGPPSKSALACFQNELSCHQRGGFERSRQPRAESSRFRPPTWTKPRQNCSRDDADNPLWNCVCGPGCAVKVAGSARGKVDTELRNSILSCPHRLPRQCGDGIQRDHRWCIGQHGWFACTHIDRQRVPVLPPLCPRKSGPPGVSVVRKPPETRRMSWKAASFSSASLDWKLRSALAWLNPLRVAVGRHVDKTPDCEAPAKRWVRGALHRLLIDSVS